MSPRSRIGPRMIGLSRRARFTRRRTAATRLCNRVGTKASNRPLTTMKEDSNDARDRGNQPRNHRKAPAPSTAILTLATTTTTQMTIQAPVILPTIAIRTKEATSKRINERQKKRMISPKRRKLESRSTYQKKYQPYQKHNWSRL